MWAGNRTQDLTHMKHLSLNRDAGFTKKAGSSRWEGNISNKRAVS